LTLEKYRRTDESREAAQIHLLHVRATDHSYSNRVWFKRWLGDFVILKGNKNETNFQ